MARTEEFISIIKLNTEQAKKELDLLKKKKEALETSRKSAISSGDVKEYDRLNQELKKVDSRFWRILQKIMVDKTERHFSVDLSDIKNEVITEEQVQRARELLLKYENEKKAV
jgi:hypothetical protein